MPNPLAFIGEPLDFKGKLKIYPPKIRDVIANEKFGMYRNIFVLTAEDIQDQLKDKNPEAQRIPTPFEFLLINCYHDKEFYNLTREAFRFFTHEDLIMVFERKIIIIGNIREAVLEAESIDDLNMLTEEDFFDFQNAIRVSLGEKPQKPPELENPNELPEIKRMKELARKRDRIKAKHHSKDGISLQTTLTAICCMGIGITPLNIGEMSYAAIGPIVNMMQEKEKYDIDIRSLLAGADSKKIKPKYWIRNNEKD